MRQYVAVILVKPDGSVLSQHRDIKETILGSNTWCTVGGAQDPEDPRLVDAAVRELREESEYEVPENKLQVLTEDDYVTEKGVPVHRTIYLAPYDGQQPIICHEGQEIRFISPQEFGSLNFYTGHEHFMRLASEKAPRSGQERK